jgi:hypothetical protein
MRTSFELRLVAATINEAKSLAAYQVANFLDISEKEVENRVDFEFKISYPKAETVAEIESSIEAGIYQVTVYGSVKKSVTSSFNS